MHVGRRVGVGERLRDQDESPTQKKKKKKQKNPHSILVVPVVSRSVDVDAPIISCPLLRNRSLNAVTTCSCELIKRVMEDDGLADANLVHSSDTVKHGRSFGADRVVYRIERWDAQYAVLSTVTTVELSYTLKSGTTGQELWTRTQKLALTRPPTIHRVG